jgi:hypothetical protein
MMEFMTAVNRLLHKSPNCRRRRLAVQCYAVTPLDQECGLIEWVPNVMPMRNLCKQYYDMHQIPFSTSSIKTRHAAAIAQPKDCRVAALVALVHALMLELPPVMHLWLVDTFRAPSAWFDARLAFTRSNGVMSMIGMAVGLGDRHLENILVDSTTGSVMITTPRPPLHHPMTDPHQPAPPLTTPHRPSPPLTTPPRLTRSCTSTSAASLTTGSTSRRQNACPSASRRTSCTPWDRAAALTGSSAACAS